MRRWIAIGLGALAVLVVAAVVAVVVVVGRPSPAGSGAAAADVPPPVAWKPCTTGQLAAAKAQCGTVTAPLDHAEPNDGRTVRIAVSRVEHTASPYAGVILVNPGGPGASGLALSTQGAQVPRGVGARYDWIGFDPRGVGASRPRLTCDADYADGARPPYDPVTTASVRAWRQRSDAYARACGHAGSLLDHMTTRDAAEDLETLRQALRVDAISYYGYSYGTYLGQVYATLHPDRVRRMVLDSTVDPTRVWYDANLDQDTAFDTAFTAWFDWLADHDATYGLGATRAAVESAYTRTAARLAAHPAAGRFGSAEWADTMLYAGYSQSLWPQLGAAFSAAANGDADQAEQDWTGLNDVSDDNGYAVYLAVECTDTSWPADWATWARDTRRVDAKAPFSTWLNTWFNAPCRTWHGATHRPVRVDGAKAPPILMIDETLDAATPYSGSVAVRRLFPKARLLAEPGGTTHADSLSGNACVDGAVADYLGGGALPARRGGDGPDTTCAPLPTPSP